MSSALIKFFSLIFILLVPAFLLGQQRVISHLTSPGGGFTTTVYLQNTTGDPQDYDLQPFNGAGVSLPVVSGTIGPQSTYQFTVSDLFNSTDVSHFYISESSGNISVLVAYRILDGPGSPAHVQESSLLSAMWRLFPGDWSQVFDGFAVVNTGSEATDVFLRQVDFSGLVLETVSVTSGLSPNAKALYVIGGPNGSAFEPRLDAFFEITASQDLAITALRGTVPGAPVGFLWENKALPFQLNQSGLFVSPSGSNTNPGTFDQPWQTIQYGVDRLSSGDTLTILPGVYHETVLFQGNDDSGAIGNPVFLTAEPGAVIDGTGLTPHGRQGLITLSNASHVVVDGFELRNFQTSNGDDMQDTPVGILVEGTATGVSIRNNRIHDIRNNSSCGQSTDCGPGANGIAVYGTSSAGITDIELRNNEVYNCILSSSEAFTLNGNINGFSVIGNYVHDNNNIGFDFIGYEEDVCPDCTAEQNRARNGIVKSNRAVNNTTTLFGGNPWYEGDEGSAGGFYVDGGRFILFDSNLSSQNDLGFEFGSEHPQLATEDILMVNNFVYLNQQAGISLGGYEESSQGSGGGSARRIFLNNNSFYHNQGWGSEISLAFRVLDSQFVNNIFFGVGDVGENLTQEDNGQHQGLFWQNNIWWGSSTEGQNTLPGTAIVADPRFVDANQGILRIESDSPAVDQGINLPDLSSWSDPFWQTLFSQGLIPAHGTSDINGETRMEGTIDIGADEYGNTPIPDPAKQATASLK